MKKGFFSSLVLAAICAALVVAGLPGRLSSQAPEHKAKRINRAIELLEQGQPIYYTSASGAGYEEGKKMAHTWADYITYEMEHGAFDITRLRDFMRGLVDGGPTKSGHKTPAVICTLPVPGIDHATMMANSWMVEQVLSSGVHGILLVHARTPEAVRTFVRASRYPFHKPAPGIEEGLRGNGGQSFASRIWGVSGDQYLQIAEPWPLNPKGEILLGLKIEDRHALAHAEASTKVPGIGFAEWGPGDMGMSLGFPSNHDEPFPQSMQDARARVLAACKAAKIAFLNTVRPDDVEMRIKEGVMIGAGSQEAAEKGRRLTKRQMPW